jgi:phosphatidylserine decarboxylase
MRLSRYGIFEIVVGTALLAVIAALLAWIWWPLALVVLPVWLWLIAFFRDPERAIPTQVGILVSPADGTVSDVGMIEHDEHLGGPALRVGIFLSVFNVHVNRCPCDARVLKTIYRKGKFLNAMKHDVASADNESNTIVLGDVQTGRPIATVRQIVGLIARRIICTSNEGDVLRRGQRIGLIKFGSRTELCVPAWLSPEATVKVGQKVRGAMDVICTIGLPDGELQHEEAKQRRNRTPTQSVAAG